MPNTENEPPSNTSSHMSGSSGDLVQARDISGGVHFYATEENARPVPAQLPGDVYGFVNRSADIEILDRLLCSPDEAPGQAAVCVLTGAPGIGKTALAVRWAHRVRRHFSDGQLYVNLRGYDWERPIDPQRALTGFLIALGVAPGAIPGDTEERSSLYRSLLSQRQMLIVLDNAATAAQVRPLLPGVGRCRVLITSRGLLSGLATRGGARRLTLNLLSEADSVELLRSTTAPYRSGDGEGEIAELVRLCARLPLALRIAAERAAARPRMTLAALIRDLRDESSLWAALTTNDPEEAEAVRSVFAWSYRALPEPTARLFRVLGTFAGADFSAKAAAVLAGLAEVTARRLLGDLVDAHLIEQTAEDRYQFHDLLRAYAADLVVQTDSAAELEAAQSELLKWYLRCAAELALLDPYAFGHRRVELEPPATDAPTTGFSDFSGAIDWFHFERANLTAVLHAAVKTEPKAAAWLIPALLRNIYDRERAFDDWFATAQLGLTTAQAMNSDDGRLFLLSSLGRAHFASNNFDEANRCYEGLLELCQRLNNLHDKAVAHNLLGLLEIRRHHMRQAIAHLERCGELCEEHGFLGLSVNPATNLAQAFIAFGRPAEALAMAERAIEVNRAVGSEQAEMYALLYRAEAQLASGAVAGAARDVELARELAERSRSRAEEGIVLLRWGDVQLARGEADAALDSYQNAAMIARRSGDRQREALALQATGTACRRLGRFGDAEDFHRAALVAWRSLRDPWSTAAVLVEIVRDLEQSGPGRDHQPLRDEALDLIQEFDDPAAVALRNRLGQHSAGTGS